MAKWIPTASVEEMEAYMRYSIKPNEWMNTDYQRYYSDLELVSADLHSRTLREYEEERKRNTVRFVFNGRKLATIFNQRYDYSSSVPY